MKSIVSIRRRVMRAPPKVLSLYVQRYFEVSGDRKSNLTYRKLGIRCDSKYVFDLK